MASPCAVRIRDDHEDDHHGSKPVRHIEPGLRSASNRPDLPLRRLTPFRRSREIRSRGGRRTFLSQHVNVNQAQPDGMTALHWAAYRDDLETAKLLVNAKADVKAANHYSVTPLSLACTNGNSAMVELLLAAGAD